MQRLLNQNKHNQKPRSFHNQDRRFDDRRQFDDRRRRDFQDQRPFKHRPIHKEYRDDRNDRPRFRNDRDRDESPRERPRKVEKQEEGEKHFRTLKVMGLSPEITNEDLYVKIR